jgi:hypothetical protein
MNNLLKNYIKIIINESFDNIEPESSAIFGRKNTNQEKSVYRLLKELDKAFEDAINGIEVIETNDTHRKIMNLFRSKNYKDSEKTLVKMKDNSGNIYLEILYKLFPNLPIIGEGSSRTTIAIDDKFVVKIDRYTGQNQKEADPKLQSILSPYIPRIYAASSLQSKPWIIAERCKTIINDYQSQREWLLKAGVSQETLSKDPYITIYKWANSVIDKSKYADKNYNKSENDYKSEFELKIIEMVESGMIYVTEISSSNVGYGLDGRAVILDIGA